MSRPYFIKRVQEVIGPFTSRKLFEEARSGGLKPTDLISRSKTGPWTEAIKVKGLDFPIKSTKQIVMPTVDTTAIQQPRQNSHHSSALLACPDCEGKVSKRAQSCPHCGAPLEQFIEYRQDKIADPNAKPRKFWFGTIDRRYIGINPNGCCFKCRKQAATINGSYHSVSGLLVLYWFVESYGEFCKSCSKQLFVSHSLRTLSRGWWGIQSFVFTLLFLCFNIISVVRARHLATPPIRAKVVTMADVAIDKVEPFTDELNHRLDDLEAERIPNDNYLGALRVIAAKADVPVWQIHLYVEMVLKRTFINFVN